MNPDGLSIPVEWRDDGAVPVMIFLKDGLIAEKVVSNDRKFQIFT